MGLGTKVIPIRTNGGGCSSCYAFSSKKIFAFDGRFICHQKQIFFFEALPMKLVGNDWTFDKNTIIFLPKLG